MWIQKEFSLKPRPRGFHLVTNEMLAQLPELRAVEIGILHLFIQHTSASLTINENADSDVRHDLEQHFNHFVPENAAYYEHTTEGSDDMSAHIKSVILGNSLSLPISNGRLRMGVWQGIYLCEHRNYGGARRIVATIHGQTSDNS